MERTVRRATPADAGTMSALNAIVQRLHHAAHPDIFAPADPGAAEQDFHAWLADPEWYGFLAEDPEHNPVGYVGAQVIRYPPTRFIRASAWLRLDQMAVLPDVEGQGYGTALVHRVKQLAFELGIEDIQLNVWSFNERAQAFYQREGFEVFRLEMRAKVDSPTLKNVE